MCPDCSKKAATENRTPTDKDQISNHAPEKEIQMVAEIEQREKDQKPISIKYDGERSDIERETSQRIQERMEKREREMREARQARMMAAALIKKKEGGVTVDDEFGLSRPQRVMIADGNDMRSASQRFRRDPTAPTDIVDRRQVMGTSAAYTDEQFLHNKTHSFTRDLSSLTGSLHDLENKHVPRKIDHHKVKSIMRKPLNTYGEEATANDKYADAKLFQSNAAKQIRTLEDQSFAGKPAPLRRQVQFIDSEKHADDPKFPSPSLGHQSFTREEPAPQGLGITIMDLDDKNIPLLGNERFTRPSAFPAGRAVSLDTSVKKEKSAFREKQDQMWEEFLQQSRSIQLSQLQDRKDAAAAERLGMSVENMAVKDTQNEMSSFSRPPTRRSGRFRSPFVDGTPATDSVPPADMDVRPVTPYEAEVRMRTSIHYLEENLPYRDNPARQTRDVQKQIAYDEDFARRLQAEEDTEGHDRFRGRYEEEYPPNANIDLGGTSASHARANMQQQQLAYDEGFARRLQDEMNGRRSDYESKINEEKNSDLGEELTKRLEALNVDWAIEGGKGKGKGKAGEENYEDGHAVQSNYQYDSESDGFVTPKAY